MKRYRVEVGYLVPHVAVIEVEAQDEDEAQKAALDEAWETVPQYEPRVDEGGSLEVFDWSEVDDDIVKTVHRA